MSGSRQDRLPTEVRLRAQGHSLRAIADAVGVSLGTVQRDLATVSGDTVPDRVTGLDGKSRPARRKKPPAAERGNCEPIAGTSSEDTAARPGDSGKPPSDHEAEIRGRIAALRLRLAIDAARQAKQQAAFDNMMRMESPAPEREP